jgi:hypothetical protein
MLVMARLLFIALLANLFIRPVDPIHHLQDRSKITPFR